MSTGGEYVAAVYGVVLFALLLYVVVIGLRSTRVAREAELLATLVEREQEEMAEAGRSTVAPPPAPQSEPVQAPRAPTA